MERGGHGGREEGRHQKHPTAEADTIFCGHIRHYTDHSDIQSLFECFIYTKN